MAIPGRRLSDRVTFAEETIEEDEDKQQRKSLTKSCEDADVSFACERSNLQISVDHNFKF
jgi:hypothetical protein